MKLHVTGLLYNESAGPTDSLYREPPDSKVHGANMGPTWVLSAPDEPHVDPMNLAIWAVMQNRSLWYLSSLHLVAYLLGVEMAEVGQFLPGAGWIEQGKVFEFLSCVLTNPLTDMFTYSTISRTHLQNRGWFSEQT